MSCWHCPFSSELFSALVDNFSLIFSHSHVVHSVRRTRGGGGGAVRICCVEEKKCFKYL